MIIVSQDREKFIDNINLRITHTDEGYLIYNMKLPAIDLGIYETKERAKEVLKDIVQTYRMNGNCVVYEMPEE